MRPQRFAADHHMNGKVDMSPTQGFNEAAAIRCGSLVVEDGTGLPNAASMRPQRFAADHLVFVWWSRRDYLGFNEAAAIRCGSPAP